MYQYQVNDCQCESCIEKKNMQDYVVRYISNATIYHGLTELVHRDLYQDALVSYHRRRGDYYRADDPYMYGQRMHEIRTELNFARYEDDRFSVLDDGSIVSHWKWTIPSKYGKVVGTYSLARVAEYVSWKVQREIEKDRQPYSWSLYYSEAGKNLWCYERDYSSFEQAKERQMIYTFGEERNGNILPRHNTLLHKRDRYDNLMDYNVMEWCYSSEHGFHVEERNEVINA